MVPAHINHGARVAPDKLRTDQVDRVSSWLLAWFVFMGMFVLFTGMIWLLDHDSPPDGRKPLPPKPGRQDHAKGEARDFEPPGQPELLAEAEPSLADTLQAVTDTVSTVAASWERQPTDALDARLGNQRGDKRSPGPLDDLDGEDIIPSFERWELKFQAKSMATYAEQLDFFQIELGAFGKSNQGLETVANISKSPKTSQNPDPSTEKRLYFRFTQSGPLERWDNALLQKAGVNLSGSLVMKFIPKNLEDILAKTELDFAKTKGVNSVTKIAKTVFESQPSGSGYQFVVVDQRYRK